MGTGEFQVSDYLDPNGILERFLTDCQSISEEIGGDDYTFSYIADTIAAIYYYRQYSSCEQFLQENAEHLDEDRTEWVKYMWRTLDSMTDAQRAEVVIESLAQIPVNI